MAQAMIKISNDANQLLDRVIAKYGLKDRSEAMEKIVVDYGEDVLKPRLKPEFIKKMKRRQKEPTVKISNFKSHFGID